AIAAVDAQLPGVAVGEARAEREHEVALEEQLVGEALAGLDPDRARPQRVVLAYRALAHVGWADGDLQVLGELHQAVRGVGDDHAATRQQQRALGLQEHRDRLANRRRVGRRALERQRGVPVRVPVDLRALLDVERQ